MPFKIFFGNRAAAGGVTAYTLTANTGACTFTGFATGLMADRVLAASTGAVVLNGFAVGLIPTSAQAIMAGLGTFSLNGNAVNLIYTEAAKIIAATGAIVLNGNDVSLVYTPLTYNAYVMTASVGSFSVSGMTVEFEIPYPVEVQPGPMQFGRTVVLRRW